VRDEHGEATGVFQEEAIELISKAIPQPTETQLRDAVQAATEDLWRVGVVSVHAPEGRDFLSLMTRMRQDNVLRMRTHYLPPISMAEELVGVGQCAGLGDRWLRFGGLKIFLDGALGSSTGLMHEAHEGQPENFGVEVTPPEEFRSMVEHAHANGWTVAVHAIGDLAVDRAIDTISASQTEHGIRRDDPGIWDRIEHFECLSTDAAERTGRARIAAMMQPVHIFDDWRPADRLWGERARRAYACRSSIDAGVPIALGSDSPVASANPWLGIHAAVRRTDMENLPEGGWYTDEALSIDQALRGYCLVPALVADEISWRGRLAPGCVADFVALNCDPWAEETDYRQVEAAVTVVDGCVVFDRSGARDESDALQTGL
jgi:predicted amidohydrolase YtcJ